MVEYIRRKNQPLNRNEEHLFSQLEKMKEELQRPGQFNARLHELVTNVKASTLNNEPIEYPALDKETIEKIQEVCLLLAGLSRLISLYETFFSSFTFSLWFFFCLFVCLFFVFVFFFVFFSLYRFTCLFDSLASLIEFSRYLDSWGFCESSDERCEGYYKKQTIAGHYREEFQRICY
jgi:hypothetical protein